MELLQDLGVFLMEQKNNKQVEVNRIVELDKRIKQGLCDPSLCSQTCPNCPMKLNKGRRKK